MLGFFVLTSCGKREDTRVYKEVHITPPHQEMGEVMKNSHEGLIPPQMNKEVLTPQTALSWDTPANWKEERGSGLRLVTFNSLDDSSKIECSIVTLSGQAGGIRNNIIRWMGQINIAIPSDDSFDLFLSSQVEVKTSSSLKGIIVDLTQLQEDQSDESPSMIAVILESESGTIFVKMTGTKKAVTLNKSELVSLSRSIKYQIQNE